MIRLFLMMLLGQLVTPICIVLPKSDGKCMFSAENIWRYDANKVSRYERKIDFGINNGGNGWRLSGFNDLKFNIYGTDKTGEIARWENARKSRIYPFKAKIALEQEYKGKVKISYRGNINNGDFSKEIRTKELFIDNDETIINYQNYKCADKTDNCFESLIGIDSLSDKEAVLKIEKVK